MHGVEVFSRHEWSWDEGWLPLLKGKAGEEIRVGCRMINGSTHERVTSMTISSVSRSPIASKSCVTDEWDCWYNFTLVRPTIVACVWQQHCTGPGMSMRQCIGLSFRFKIDMVEPDPTTPPDLTSPPPFDTLQDGVRNIPLLATELHDDPWDHALSRYSASTGTQQNRRNLSLSVLVTCSPFLSTSYAGWSAWLHKRTLISPKRSKRDVTGVLGTGLGVLNSIDAEVLANKLATVTNDLGALKHPLQSSLSALGANQWLLSDLLPQWGKVNEKDHQLIVDALGAAQNNVSLALSCIQAQLWMQSIVAAIIREGEEGTMPTEIQKVIWDNATEFEKEFQCWWYPVNFTYDPTDGKATAFVLTIRNASVYTMYPIIALGLNHNGAILYPLEHRVWAQQNGNLWQTIDVSACVVREQQGFICESNTLKAQDICLDTEQNVCHFEVQPDEGPETVLVYIGKGCVCMRTFCDSVFVDNTTVDIGNHSKICVCNFTKIMGCDFNYSAPVTTHQLLQADYTLHQDLLPAPIGMKLTLVRKLLQHDDLNQLLERIWNNGHKILVTVHQDVEEIHRVLERVKQDGRHRWWDGKAVVPANIPARRVCTQ
ncbi:hypothetical protein QYF61_007003 [Mycteria americana]|uniref:Uncharacterized protein n=1 Tax=Mycteria americana TaxID=33587 RepID=A0AAN7RQ74_MYCAM|nr:hypothetical protein QYF61_007003 [Mycteria americana]